MTSPDWQDIAKERLEDAKSLSESRDKSISAPYLAGYAIECALKGYLQDAGIPFPKRGSEGHNLKALWRKADFRIAEINDDNGTKAYYVNSWNTALRYEVKLSGESTTFNTEELVKGAQDLYQWINRRNKRTRRRSRY
jgi:HEPN domain-containing protein